MKRVSKQTLIFCTLLAIVGFSLYQLQTKVLAEQSGSSPESGVTSRIKTIYDSLVALSHGSDSAGGWGNWGVMWNRIRSAAEWVPSGDASEADVASGKTFYKDSRTQKTGTGSLAPDYSEQSRVMYNDAKNGASADGDEANEESIWTNTAGNATTGVWNDTRTSLYWSANLGSGNNNYTIASCDFFSATDRGTYSGADSDCGYAINTCGTLSQDATGDAVNETDWYLPTQKELQQAYIDGMYNQTNITFASSNEYWSATEFSDSPGMSWYLGFYYGNTSANANFGIRNVRCVRRD